MEDMTFNVYVGVKKENHKEAKIKGFKYDVQNKKWFITFNYYEFLKNEELNINNFKSYNIELFSAHLNDRVIKTLQYDIYRILKSRNNKNIE